MVLIMQTTNTVLALIIIRIYKHHYGLIMQTTNTVLALIIIRVYKHHYGAYNADYKHSVGAYNYKSI